MFNVKNAEIDTTVFLNIDDKKFVFFINKQPREVEAGEQKTWPIFVCQIGAKHLVDRILQEKHGVKDTLRDTELRKNLFAKILPEMAEERGIKPLSPEEEKAVIQKELARQSELIKSFTETQKDVKEKDDEKDKKIAELEAKVNKLLEAQEETKVVKKQK